MLSNLAVNYSYDGSTGTLDNANVIFGNIPCRPIAGATGVFTNDSIQRIEADVTGGDLAAAKKGEAVEITLDYKALTVKMNFIVTEVMASKIRVDGVWETKTIISLTIDPETEVEYAKVA